jgi:uncharacterized protein (TIGR02302 family)
MAKSTRRALRLSRWALAAERLARAFWPTFSVICLILAAALLGAFALLDTEDHRIAMLALVGLVALSVIWGAIRFRMPSREEAARRLDASDPGHPIATLDDSIAGGRNDRAAQAIWHEHLRRAAQAAAQLRATPPDPRLYRFDRWALRLFAPALLIGGLIGAGEGWDEQLRTLIAPTPEATQPVRVAARSPAAEGWAIPPSYTGLPTIYLNKQAQAGEEIRVPVGSELILRVTDLAAEPVLTAPGVGNFEGFTDFGGALAEARAVLQASGPIELRDGETPLVLWEIAAVPDAPPSISMPDPPGATLAGALQVPFEARDDYGVDAAWAEIVPMGGIVKGKGLEEEPIVFALPLPISGRALEVADSAVRDFGEHPWAGAWVELTLHAEDGAGQRATAGPVTLRLPGRYFTHPLARALVEQRRELAMDFEQGTRTLDVLQSVTRRPEAIFDDNAGAYLGTRTAIRRLADGVVADRVSKVAADVTEYLWLAALSLEDGDLSSALERLRTAEEALRRALESGTEEDIRRAMDELRAAIQEYLEEMVRQALERGLDPNQQNAGQQQQMLSQQDLQEMLDELQRRAESGLRDQARELLSELSRMLEQLQAGRMQQGGQGQQTLQELQEMIQRQRDLADRTFDELRRQRREGQRDGQMGQQGQQQGQQGMEGQQPGQRPGEGRPGGSGAFGDLSGAQEALRRALEELAGRIPGGIQALEEALGEAGRAMGEARDDLELSDPGAAVEDQMEALDKLSQGAEALAEQMQNGQGMTATRGRGRREGQARDLDADPFDRPSAAFGAIDGRDTKVPDRSVLDRARELLEELRRRAGEPTRPQLELDYFDRLMDQF